MERKVFLIKERKVEDEVLYLKLFPKDGKNLLFNSGQFVKFYSLNLKQTPSFRFYSINSTPFSQTLDFSIKVVGRFSNYIASLEIGEEIGIEGPYGAFSFTDQKKMIFIAGGVGIAPIISALRNIHENKIKGTFILVFSNKNDKFPFYSELLKLSENSSIKIIFTITRDPPPNWKGEVGRFSEEMIHKCCPPLNGFSAFVCGPPQMALAAKECLINLGVKKEEIEIEAWG